MRNKMSKIQERQIQKSNCYECAFRYPLDHAPHSCLYGIRDEFAYNPDDHLCSCPNCDHFIHEDRFKKNIDKMFGITKDLADWADQMRLERTTVTIEVPTEYISLMVDFLISRGVAVNAIRRMFKLEEK